MTTIHLTKHHALGNDFLVLLDAPDVVRADIDLAALAHRLCDRRRGIGADGLLVAEPAAGYTARMTLFNADGSRAEMSGNGIRCFAQALATERGRLDDQLILTDAGDRTVTMTATAEADTISARVDMGAVGQLAEPSGWATLGCHPDRPVMHLSLGNPHSVVGVDEVAVVDLVDLGGKVPHVNLEIVEPGPETTAITMRVHERGAGVTEACGTGACAAAYAARSWGLVAGGASEVTVHMDGGTAIVGFDAADASRVSLTGPATFIGSIHIDLGSDPS
ncbi:MAG: diaminopimelate epimerase [Ilumatobacteraceae bacterium]